MGDWDGTAKWSEKDIWYLLYQGKEKQMSVQYCIIAGASFFWMSLFIKS